jgi:hypothetical protein
MGGRIWLAFALLIAAEPAWGQSEKDYANYARPVIDKFTACERPKITKWARTTQDAPDALADRATAECQEHLDELQKVMESAPFNRSPADAKAEIDDMLKGMRPLMIDDIEKVRRGS